MSKSNKNIEISFNTLEYWDKARDILSAAGRYAYAVKLKVNFEDEATHFKVKHVVERYYDNDLKKLDDDIHYHRTKIFKEIAKINELCRRYNIHTVTGKEALAEFLIDERRRKGWRKLIKKHQNANEIVSLQTIEMEYRNSLKGS